MFKFNKILLLLLLLMPVFVLTACSQDNNKESTESAQEISENNSEGDNIELESSNTNPRHIVMMGRSVMNGWFVHWGWDGENPMQLDRYTLEYHELSSPPETVDSVRNIMNELPEDKKDIIFFKFCFEDFLGDDAASKNLERNKKFIEEIHQIVTKEHGAELIIGNALPKVIGDTDIYLVWNHQQFISWLDDFWRNNSDNLTVFDMYNPVTNDLGALSKDYAINENDSHLNDDAYNLLDEKFFNMLDNVY